MMLSALGVLSGFILGVLVVEGVQKLKYKIQYSRIKLPQQKDPSFIAVAYKKFKTKTCFKIKFED